MYKQYKGLLAEQPPTGKGTKAKGKKRRLIPQSKKGRKSAKSSAPDRFKAPSSLKLYYGKARKRPKFWERDATSAGKIGVQPVDVESSDDEAEEPKTTLAGTGKNKPKPIPKPAGDSASKPEPTEPGKRKPKPIIKPKPVPPPKPKPEPPMTEPSPEDLATRLIVKDVDYHIRENTVAHHTDKYECTKRTDDPELVCRRGQPIKMTITFCRPYDKADNDLRVIFETGRNPKPGATQAIIDVLETSGNTPEPDEWCAEIVKEEGNDVTLKVHIPANCIVAEWNVLVQTFSMGKNKDNEDVTLISEYGGADDIYIIFNPWCPDDQVYMEPSEEMDEREEYVSNAQGSVYRGNAYFPRPKAWNFAQFENGILDAAMYLLRSGSCYRMSGSMADAVAVTRTIAQMVNCSDDGGVLVGNWSGNYEDGVSPTKWVGSGKLLRQYMEQMQPVKYGQCWVFSALTTTVCRALGIPCRSVTNFSSAHDTDGNTTIDKYMVQGEDGLEAANSNDSVWNFHVWNEVWFSWLDDELEEYDGWQAIDATPQELSDGLYVCGPCPIWAIKKGELQMGYDTPFVFAEVNGDRITWKLNPDGTKERISVSKNSVGKSISTKKPDGKPFDPDNYDHRLDVTECYKYPEGSLEERQAVFKANQKASNPEEVYGEAEKHWAVELKLKHKDDVMLGKDVDIALIARNTKDSDRTIAVAKIVTSAGTYDGTRLGEIKRSVRKSCVIKAGQEETFNLTLTEDDYLPKLCEQFNIIVDATTIVDKSPDDWSSEVETLVKMHEISLTPPNLKVTSDGKGKVGQPMTFTVSFTNPVKVTLTKCNLSFDCCCFKDQADVDQSDVKGREEFSTTMTLTPITTGDHSIVFSFDCAEIPDISGTATICIEQ